MLNKELVRIFVFSLLLLLMASCKNDEPKTVENVVRPVKIIIVEDAKDLETINYPAVIQATGAVNLTFQVGGLIQELPIVEAQQVKKGELIAKLDQRDFISQVDSTRAQYELAEQDYQRSRRLIKRSAVAQRELEKHKSERDAAKAQLDMAKKALADTELRAPYSGLIAKLPVKRLQNVQAGAAIASMIDAKNWEATINLPASVVALAPTRQSRGASLVLSAAPEMQIPAKFKEATLEADAVSQTYAITFSFQVPENLQVLPGMNADIILKSSTKEKKALETSVAVPLAAVQSDALERFVWVVNTDTMTVSKRPVKIQDGIGETLVITEGLVVGEAIVATGAAYLSEGMEVRPWKD